MRGFSEPSWKSGPPEPKHRHSEHEIHEPVGIDMDGVGKGEAERLDSKPLCAVQEAFSCARDGCDFTPTTRYVYGEESVSDRLRACCEYAVEQSDVYDDWGMYAAEHMVVADYDDGYIMTIKFGDDAFGTIYPTFEVGDDPSGPCHGRTEPDYDLAYERHHDI